jgi:DUF4097 and DUF4098 domain-containing protein YvlB
LGALGGCILLIIACANKEGTFQPTLGILLGFSLFGCIAWAAIDWILILCKGFTDGQGRRMTCWLHPQTGEMKTGASPIAGPPPTPPAGGAAPPAGPGSSLPPVAPNGPSPAGAAMVVAPAVGLMIAAGWKLCGEWLGIHSIIPLLGSLPGNWGFGSLSNLFSIKIMLFSVIPALLIFFGAFQMMRLRSYAWAVAAGILAILICSLVCLAMGIWALLVLARPEVKNAFEMNRLPAQPPALPPRGGGAGIIVAAVVGLLLLLALLGGGAALAYGLAHFSSAAEVQANEVSKDINLTYPLDADGRFSIDNISGHIEITGSDRNEVVVKGTIHGHTREGVDAVKTDVDSGLDHVVILTRQPSNTTGFPYSWPWFKRIYDERVDYTIEVPRHARLKDVSSVSGNVTITGVSGSIGASTVSGDMQVTGAAGNLNLSTVSGGIEAELVSLGHGQSVSFKTISGRIEATLPANANAKISANAISGHIRSDFPVLIVKKENPVGHNLHGTLGNGGASVKATTISGDISFQSAKIPVSPEAEQAASLSSTKTMLPASPVSPASPISSISPASPVTPAPPLAPIQPAQGQQQHGNGVEPHTQPVSMPSNVPVVNTPPPAAPAVATAARYESGSEASFSHSFTVGPQGKLTVNVGRGSIHLVGSEQDTVEISVTREVTRASESDVAEILKAHHVVLRQNGDEISVSANEPSLGGHGSWWSGWDQPQLNVHYDITVPRKFVSRLETSGGAIEAASLGGNLTAKTQGGSLDFDGIAGDVDGETEGGSIHSASCDGHLSLKTEGGGITIKAFAGPDVQAETDGGSVSADFAVPPRSDCTLHTSGGNVTANLPGTAAVTVDAHTSGGSTSTDLPVQIQGEMERETLRGTINGGGPRLTLETDGGNIRIQKRK